MAAWDDDEDAVLLRERKRGTPYEDIAKRLAGRTRSACENRYYVLRNTRRSKDELDEDEDSDLEGSQSRAYASWTKDEEQRLLRLRKEMKDASWAEIASKTEGRSADSCRTRYLLLIKSRADIDTDDGYDDDETESESEQYLKKRVATNWSKREDRILRREREENDASWDDISKKLQNRSAGACSIRYSRIIIKEKERIKRSNRHNKNRHNKKLREYLHHKLQSLIIHCIKPLNNNTNKQSQSTSNKC